MLGLASTRAFAPERSGGGEPSELTMGGPRFCPIHNFKDIDWDELCAAVAQRKHQRTLTAR
jgi:hypothetical protein